MANRRRGEIAATVAGRSYTLCLTMGSLAELEDAFGVDDLSELGRRFGSGRLSSRDLIRILGAGLRGAGEAIGDDAVRDWPGSALPEIAAAVTELLAATFGDSPGDPPVPQGA